MRRHTRQATLTRRAGHFASADTCGNVAQEPWVTQKLRFETHLLSPGDLALLCEHAPQQWQRDYALSLLSV